MQDARIQALWAHVHALGVLARQGSYTAAAQRLGISKAAMSQRIAELERAAGVPLVLRTTRSVRLTEAGQQLVDATREAYEQIERSFAGVKDMAGAPRGLVRVTAPVALGRQQIVPRLGEFLRRHPEVRVELDLADRLVPLAQEGFDLAIRHTAAAPETHVAWVLCETRSWLVASRAYLRRRGAPQTPEALAEHECLTYLRPGEAPSWSFVAEGARRGEARRVTVPVRGPFSANNSEVLREAVLDGLGLAVLPDFSAQSALRAGRLQAVLPGWRPVGAFGERIYAIRPYSPVVPRAVQALVAYLREVLAAGFAP
ncbi:LysR family transcriptional regulator [Caldimonas thermodepolymerans]|jgi:Transcriptional regulator|uniref:LysR family transcriptional regulator n=1 Tax=Caldimonas thermodepolymerans TaxID=215580 RepID=A0A2S5T1F5_9BURK|nr:LysR family transcriptional regulator [Caldimonas thermodepolymerans]PPE68687.1 LysR family transcriptional regulator [Caldimonas thermodepolymerans]QPC31523.1 LysR family transcriptional regulator [Caldimonas thermodepolymerans]RDH95129.1 LysR family transcriptional regulator [Caldimonas thermodepolymerans]